jgi:hypothetical protein
MGPRYYMINIAACVHIYENIPNNAPPQHPIHSAHIETQVGTDRSISGYVCSCSSLVKAFCVYSRKHLPGRVRPARPARWLALACRRPAVGRPLPRALHARPRYPSFQRHHSFSLRRAPKHQLVCLCALRACLDPPGLVHGCFQHRGARCMGSDEGLASYYAAGGRTWEMAVTRSDSTRMRGLYTCAADGGNHTVRFSAYDGKSSRAPSPLPDS